MGESTVKWDHRVTDWAGRGYCEVGHVQTLFFFRDRVSLCSSGCPGTYFVDQASLKLRNLPASASRVLGLKACASTARPGFWVFYFCFVLFCFVLFCFVLFCFE